MTRQAYYQHFWQAGDTEIEHSLIIKEVLRIRENHRCMGGRKLYEMLQPFLLNHSIKIGRDALFELLSANRLLVKKRKRRIATTMSYHRFKKWPNLIRGFTPTAPDQLYVSDITYWKLMSRHVYISFITDAFSHKIVGYNVAENLDAVESIKAMKMALSNINPDLPLSLIHHSDRGTQYCSGEYVKLLQDNNIQISMTENGDPLENAIAERINGIIKEEYLNFYEVNSFKDASALLEKAVELYNIDRPHMSINYKTPEQIHQTATSTQKAWKNYYQQQT